ncbi:MAG: hypothetical protein K2L31_04505 [Muribaculum sp.]|nr:hypothetical protein [Muribaculum sp.]MDE6457848.1 hypothetical protein [Muribaculum sp.]
MNKWQKIVGVIAFGAIGICIGCTQSIDYTDGEEVYYYELPKEVQDTLIWWGEHTIISIGDTVIVELPDVICYNSDYSFVYTKLGPWITSRKLKRNTDGKEWKFSGNLNVPTPIVAIGDTIYIPSGYNTVSMGVDSNSVFKRQILR